MTRCDVRSCASRPSEERRAAAASLLPAHRAWADTRGRGGSQYIQGGDVLPDTSHSTDALAAHLRGYFQAKSDRNLAWQTSYYARPTLWYVAPDTGRYWTHWQKFHDAIAELYPTWPQGSNSYPTRMLGDTTSAIVFFTDTPGMFGPGQVRNASAINFDREGFPGPGEATAGTGARHREHADGAIRPREQKQQGRCSPPCARTSRSSPGNLEAWQRTAAALMEPVSATAKKYSNCRREISAATCLLPLENSSGLGCAHAVTRRRTGPRPRVRASA